MKSEVISSNNLNSESIANQISASGNKIDNLSRIIKQKDSDISALTKNLKETNEKYQQLRMKLAKSEADLVEAQELLSKAPQMPTPEESKSQAVV